MFSNQLSPLFEKPLYILIGFAGTKAVLDFFWLCQKVGKCANYKLYSFIKIYFFNALYVVSLFDNFCTSFLAYDYSKNVAHQIAIYSLK